MNDCDNCKHSDGMFCKLKHEKYNSYPGGTDPVDKDTSMICPNGNYTHWEAKE